MGWSSGNILCEELYDLVRPFIPEEKRKEVANSFYDGFCDLDADGWSGDSSVEIDAQLDYGDEAE